MTLQLIKDFSISYLNIKKLNSFKSVLTVNMHFKLNLIGEKLFEMWSTMPWLLRYTRFDDQFLKTNMLRSNECGEFSNPASWLSWSRTRRVRIGDRPKGFLNIQPDDQDHVARPSGHRAERCARITASLKKLVLFALLTLHRIVEHSKLQMILLTYINIKPLQFYNKKFKNVKNVTKNHHMWRFFHLFLSRVTV